ncbi:hypothetical protein [Actinoplanes sp. NPDC049802]|uniref:McrC family protein n=1 Tax=Actinoplanes sp. NPDC049802 TaxID=3154742 RepID=UPI0033EC9A17
MNRSRTFRASETGLLSTDRRTGATVHVPADFPFRQMLAVRGTDLLDPERKVLSPFRYVDGRTIAGAEHVGVVETAGTVVELLPKTWSPGQDPSMARAALEAMLESYVDQGRLSPRRSARRLQQAHLRATPMSVGERILQRFTAEAEAVMQAGIRFGYSPVQEQHPFLRGRLDVARQIRQMPGKEHLFHLRHTRFHPSRPENRLIKSALLRVAGRSRDPILRTRAAQLAEIMHDVPASQTVRHDLAQWDSGRLLAHYAAVRPWCRLVLEPVVGLTAGSQLGEAWLWRTDRMFERHLEVRLRARLETADQHLELVAQGGPRRHLGVNAAGEGAFRLKPDLALRRAGEFVAVLDAKWKQTDGVPSEDDAYQMFAYGHRFLSGRGPVVLVYPSTPRFTAPVRYRMGELRLVAVPFDVVADRFLIGSDTGIAEALGNELHRLLALDPVPDIR